MASFMEKLWESVFTPGPTPTLLVATNASFAALQLLLLGMLIATYSIHFIILSFLCGGLWWSINWFAVEIRAAQAKEEEAKRIREARRGKDQGSRAEDDDAGDEGAGMDTGDDTEVDTEVEVQKQRPSQARATRPESQSTVLVDRPNQGSGREGTPQAVGVGGPAGAGTTGTTTSLAPLVDDAVKKRRSMGESTGDLSTDSEWEKLSESGEK